MKIFYLMVVIVLLGLQGCKAELPQQVSYLLPKELSDCKVYKIDTDSTNPTLYVVRCSGENADNPTAAAWEVRSGKSTKQYHTILIDGAEYQRVEK